MLAVDMTQRFLMTNERLGTAFSVSFFIDIC
jgi:hypothetical protein